MSENYLAQATTDHLFVDEAGDPTLFANQGKVIVGTEGCSRYFLLGKLQADDPIGLSQKLNALRARLIRHPYFACVPSFDPMREKTALAFHAKDDLPEVRFQVLDLLAQEGERLHFHAVVCDKIKIVEQVYNRTAVDPGDRYRPNELYDDLIRSLFGKLHRLADHYHVYVARRGARNRNEAIRKAIEHAEMDFAAKFGFSRGGADVWTIEVTDPLRQVPLQAADYFLWTLQRFYEGRRDQDTGEPVHENRYLQVLWPQFGEVHDLHFGPPHVGTYFTRQNPLTFEARCGHEAKKRKSREYRNPMVHTARGRVSLTAFVL